MPKVEFDKTKNKFYVKETYEETREKYLKKIKEAELLGETEEADLLRQEWNRKRLSLKSRQ
ncbi:MAG: hypothetical protein H0Z40_01560 [Desulfotomaculum sp.]|nr:hypothetical protein [Desulfotomaculum sp.]